MLVRCTDEVKWSLHLVDWLWISFPCSIQWCADATPAIFTMLLLSHIQLGCKLKLNKNNNKTHKGWRSRKSQPTNNRRCSSCPRKWCQEARQLEHYVVENYGHVRYFKAEGKAMKRLQQRAEKKNHMWRMVEHQERYHQGLWGSNQFKTIKDFSNEASIRAEFQSQHLYFSKIIGFVLIWLWKKKERNTTVLNWKNLYLCRRKEFIVIKNHRATLPVWLCTPL